MFALPAALVAFFFSGFAALLYQVVWQRMLTLFSGADVQAATIVVATFMAGLGCGSFVGGHVADRVSRVTSLALFAAAECLVAAFGLFSSRLFYGALYLRLGQAGLGAPATAVLVFVALLWPTFLMGASLPLLTKGLTRRLDSAASVIGLLYALNTAGAAAGAFIATWVVLPQIGLEGSLRVAAAFNVLCASVAVPLALTERRHSPEPVTSQPERRDSSHSATLPIAYWPVIFAISGFVWLSLEIVWFRMLGVMLKSTSFTFGTLLAIYLCGLSLGSLVGSAVAARVRRPATWFFLAQAAAGIYVAISLVLFIDGLGTGHRFGWYSDYFALYEGVDLRAAMDQWRGVAGNDGTALGDALRLYLWLPACLILPPTVLAGVSFPLLQRVVQTDFHQLGRRVGLLLTANIVGSTIGAFLTGLGLLGWLGTAGSLRLLFLVSAGFGGMACLQLPGRFLRRGALIVATAAAVGIFVRLPDNAQLWAALHGTNARAMVEREDGSGLSVLRAATPDFRETTVFVNGHGQSWIPFGGIHTVLGALPALAHPHPRTAVLIGLGSGDTLFAMAGRQDLERLASIEIIGPQLDTLKALTAWQGYPGLTRVLSDPRIDHLRGDGRRYLLGSRERFDIIQADALYPRSAYAGNLYSDAYFRLLRDRLAPGGWAVSWTPTERTFRTFLTVFPYVSRHGAVVVGSLDPIGIHQGAFRERIAEKGVVDYYAAAGVNIVGLMTPYLDGWQTFDPSSPRSAGGINTDLNPRDEFDVPPLLRLPLQ